MPITISTRFTLPGNYQRDNFFTFHQRDTQMLSEIVKDNQLIKGICWYDLPAQLTVTLKKQQLTAELHIDSGRKKLDAVSIEKELRHLVKHMLGLNQAVDEFESFIQYHPHLGPLIAKQSGLRVPQSASAFEALSWAITGQQISVNAAVSLRRNLIRYAGVQHSSGIYCYPGAAQLIRFTVDELRSQGFSQTKAQTILELARMIYSGQLPLEQWLRDYWNNNRLPAQDIYDRLIQVKGVGPWTINYALLRGFGWLDGSLHGDVAVRRNLQWLLASDKLINKEEKISEAATKEWLVEFSPWRALVAAHLWAMQKTDGY
ncbi:DNA-3-methyladenine glycosylase family protein [Cellvibrio mixtus]|uniref:DNA-3-methyladenine glycosylase family protein n=1 Tax=Cellvibrio mixtus TaxID=39650 RepID=UPI000586E1E1|nr:DNA-3-methyladenine glycosylase 2 [Cellvibrio mixtus]